MSHRALLAHSLARTVQREKQHIINNLFWHFQLRSTLRRHTQFYHLSRGAVAESGILILHEKLEINFRELFRHRYLSQRVINIRLVSEQMLSFKGI